MPSRSEKSLVESIENNMVFDVVERYFGRGRYLSCWERREGC
jgi:hypothetical protein